MIHSSLGNDSIAESIADKIGSNVIGNNVVTQTTYKAIEGAMEISMLVSMDPAGMLPSFVKNRIASFMCNAGMIMANYLKDGTVPEPIF